MKVPVGLINSSVGGTPIESWIAGDTVIVASPQVPHPIAVRYAWAADPAGNLCNGAGLPASPFRTDDWAAPLAGKKQP
jgi:sialate O-acetylesterase